MTSQTAKWGVLSTANIARKNIRGIREDAADVAEVLCVGSRSMERAEEYCKSNGVPVAYGSYDEVLADSRVQVVYVPLPTTHHVQWVRKAAEAGKHVLCEKPVARDSKELQQMVSACAENGVQFMDGVMFMHHCRIPILKDLLAKHAPISVHSEFCFRGTEEFLSSDIRMDPSLDLHGALGDLGWYNIRISLLSFGFELPHSVRCEAHKVENGVIVDCSATLYFSGDRRATFHCSFLHAFQQYCRITSETAVLEMDDFVIPKGPESTSITVRSSGLTDMDTRVKETVETVEIRDCVQHAEMCRTMSRIALKLDSVTDTWSLISLKTQLVLDACRQSYLGGGMMISL